MPRITKNIKEYPTLGLTFVPIDMTTSRVILFTYASFWNYRNKRSKIGYIIFMADAKNNSNHINFASSRSRCVTKTVMASEYNALVLGFDTAYKLQKMI